MEMMNLNCSDADLKIAMNASILSVSGWRKVFGSTLTDIDTLLVTGMGLAWAQWLSSNQQDLKTVIVATDTRTTGPAIATTIINALHSCGFKVLYPGIAAAPEAICRSSNKDLAFAYISASHNPPEYNGVKFGLQGGVIDDENAKSLINIFTEIIKKTGVADYLADIARHRRNIKASAEEKQINLKVYTQFLEHIAEGQEADSTRISRTKPDTTLSTLRHAIKEKPVTIIADMNGSARCLSADRIYLGSLHAKLQSFNDIPGKIAHAILPEGDALKPCRTYLTRNHAMDPAALMGYVPDNDGDRGNLVIWNKSCQSACILEAQEVFALSVLAELASTHWIQCTMGGLDTFKSSKSATQTIVVNGPTSHRIRDIAQYYNCEVHEAEVGEANVVNRARELRLQGYRVRLLGEGSNGGTITHPACVRDPMNTITAMLKLLRLPSTPHAKSPFEDWCHRRHQELPENFDLSDILDTLPSFATTPSSAPRAIMKIKTKDQRKLKHHWERIFQEQWQIHRKGLAETYQFHSFIEINNEGTRSSQGFGPSHRSDKQNGGLKILFRNSHNEDTGFLWMRGSKTEPIFRIITEIRGDTLSEEKSFRQEKALTQWHGSMLARADHLCHSTAVPPPVQKPLLFPLP